MNAEPITSRNYPDGLWSCVWWSELHDSVPPECERLPGWCAYVTVKPPSFKAAQTDRKVAARWDDCRRRLASVEHFIPLSLLSNSCSCTYLPDYNISTQDKTNASNSTALQWIRLHQGYNFQLLFKVERCWFIFVVICGGCLVEYCFILKGVSNILSTPFAVWQWGCYVKWLSE